MSYTAEFLAALDAQQNKTVYVKLISLNFDETPRESIEGRATSGSVNIDGASAIRRTCSISLVADAVDISDYYWSLKSKFRVQAGLLAEATNEIVWFDQGLFVITSFSSALSTNGYTINIQGKDKMCMLNGELGGSINASLVLDSYDEIMSDGVKKKIKLPLKNIIRDLVHQWGNELYHNIIINDLDMTGLELQEYRYDTPLYLIREANKSQYTQATLQPFWTETEGFQYDSLSSFVGETQGTPFPPDDKVQQYQAAKIEYGQTAGYKEIDLVYPDELAAKAGESVTAVLDKIKNMLGDFEYFYDVDGRFIFQQKKTYLNTAWNSSVQNEGDMIYVDPYMLASPYTYSFTNSKLFTAFNNTPSLSNLKNDYTVWGEKSNGNAIHMRYAIDKKPTYYKSIKVDNTELDAYNKKYGLNVQGQESLVYWWRDEPVGGGVKCADWREIIFQMQKDYYKYSHLDDFGVKLIEANPTHYPLGKTGYEQYYIDIQGFWRYLYDPETTDSDNYYIEGDNKGWNKLVFEAPSQLLFWFDFLDAPDSSLGAYSVSAVGSRPKVDNDKDVKAIYYGDTPSIIFSDDTTQNTYKDGYKYFQIGTQYSGMFKKSTQGKSAKDAIDNLLYNFSYCTESVTITSVPIYYLQPNTLIYISDARASIEGDYMITKMTIPLTYNGTMSISGIKVVQRLY